MTLRRAEWEVRDIDLAEARRLVEAHHYARGGSRTSVFTHGLVHRATGRIHGVAWWLPPTRVAAESVNKPQWRRVLSLSRMVMEPDTPRNACSFLLARSVKGIRRDGRFVSLVTYADEAQGHTGLVYLAANWEYVGRTGANQRWLDPRTGRQVSAQATKTRTVAQMEALGYVRQGRSHKHKFVLHLQQPKGTMIVQPAAPPAPPVRTAIDTAAHHARVSPSALHRIRICNASLKMQEAFPHLPWEDEEASAEGTCAHWVLQQALTLGAVIPVKGALDPAGTPVTDEMLDAVEEACIAVDALLTKYGRTRADLVIEQPVAIRRIHPDCWGTPDIRFWGLLDGATVLVVIDFKFGFRYVDEFENEQLVAYTVGDIDEAGLYDEHVRCVNVIIQPRAYGASTVRSWEYNAAHVRAFVNVLASAVQGALMEQPTATATPEGCRNCRARHGCPTNQTAGQMAMAYSGQPQPMDLPPAALSTELLFSERALKLLESRVTGLKAQALYLAQNGARLPHHTLGTGRGKTVWNLPDDQVIAMGRVLGVDLAKEPDAITPKQALAKGLNPVLLPTLSTTRGGELRLVVDDGSTARRVFGAKEHVQ